MKIIKDREFQVTVVFGLFFVVSVLGLLVI